MNKKQLYQRIGAVLAALLIWQVAALLLNRPLLLVSPWTVFLRLFSLWREPVFFSAVGFSLSRIAAGFFLGLTVGSLLGILAGRFSWLEVLIRPYMTVIKSVPVASIIILCLIWLSSGRL